MPGEGTYFCLVCGSQLSLRETDELPECPSCGTTRFRRDSIFSSLQDHGSPTAEFTSVFERGSPRWLDEARESLTEPGYYLACGSASDDQSPSRSREGWTRIGRSATADICLDDPSVSRRHALIVAETADAASPRRPQPQRRLRQRPQSRVGRARRRRRADDRPLPAVPAADLIASPRKPVQNKGFCGLAAASRPFSRPCRS